MNIAQTVCRALRGDMQGRDACLVPGPGHSRKDRSLSVKNDSSNPDGFVVFSHGGNEAGECRDYVREHAGLPAWKPTASATRKDSQSAEYIYRDEDGAPYLKVKRWYKNGAKAFAQEYWDGYTWQKGGAEYPLPYNLPAVLESREVFVVEGEKDADRLNALGLVATCNPMGAGKWRDELNEHFDDADVIILADNDETGRKHADGVQASLAGIARSIKQVHFPMLPEKGDVSDYLDSGKGREDLLAYVDSYRASAAPVTGTWASFSQCDGSAPLVPRKELIKGLIPRVGVGFIGGQSGALKTFLALHLATCIATGEDFAGKPVKRVGGVVYVPYEGRATIEERIKARRLVMGDAARDMPFYKADDAGLLDTDEAFAAMEAGLMAKHLEMLDRHGVPLVAAIIDTVTAAGMLPEAKELDPGAWAKVFAKLNAIAERLEIAIILIHHAGKDIQAGLRGSSASRAAADFIIMMSAERDEVSGTVSNRFLHLAKSRSGEEGPIAAVAPTPVIVGHDEDGEPETTLVLEFDPEAKYTPAGQRTNNVQNLVRANDARRETDNSKWKAEIVAGIQHLTENTRNGVGKQLLREAVCSAMNASGGRSKEAMRKAYDRAFKELIEVDKQVALDENGQPKITDNSQDNVRDMSKVLSESGTFGTGQREPPLGGPGGLSIVRRTARENKNENLIGNCSDLDHVKNRYAAAKDGLPLMATPKPGSGNLAGIKINVDRSRLHSMEHR